MNKIRKGDQVIILTGRDKGKRGTVSQRVSEDKVIVDGINLVKKHVKPNPMKGATGGVIDKTMPIHQSNVAIFNAASGKADRVVQCLETPALSATQLHHREQVRWC